MKNIIGPPVTGDDFFGRNNEFDYVWELIKSGNNLVFPSPRRVGKTSFALKLLEKAKSEDWQTISINLEKNTGEKEFVETLVDELKRLSYWEKIKENGGKLFDFLKQFKPSFEYNDVKVSLDWQNHKEDVCKQLANLLDHEKPTLIFMDELTVLLSNIINQENGRRNVASFLHWMRDLRIKSGSKIRWIFCSSVGIENFTFTHHISDAINDTSDYFLKSFDAKTSKAMLQKLSNDNGVPLTPEMQEAIIEKLSFCLPFFLQLMFEKINYLHKIEGLTIDNQIVTSAYNALIEEKHFNTWIERIDEQYGDLSGVAFTLLRHICQAKEGSKRKNLVAVLSKTIADSEEVEKKVSSLLYMLKNDGYLMEQNNLYLFRSPLLRDFWFNRFVK